MKKRIKKFQAVQAVKDLARDRIGSPPPGRLVPNKKKKREKYKPNLLDQE